MFSFFDLFLNGCFINVFDGQLTDICRTKNKFFKTIGEIAVSYDTLNAGVKIKGKTNMPVVHNGNNRQKR